MSSALDHYNISSEAGHQESFGDWLMRYAKRGTSFLASGLRASGKEEMQRCYDYLQDALENEETSLFSLYKLAETVEHLLGGEREAGRILSVTQELKTTKRLANEPSRDERHAPEPHEPVRQSSEADRIKAVECGHRLLRALEANLLKCPDSTGAV